MRRSYITESAILPGCGVVQGSADNKVKAPGSGGIGDFIGVFAWEANEPKAVGDEVGIALAGVVKVVAGGNVSAGKRAVLKSDTSGSFVDLGTADGQYATCGTFLESGGAGELVDMVIERGSVTIPE
ncbi:MAG: hypothetical protein LBF77_09860 [Spirochaetaceae bacterium]|jgi:hypothetical protein|nr:hypothetical protein [Spirochaetaceae bacterium]